jgi:LemA protein
MGITLLILIALIVLMLLYGVSIYNRLVRLRTLVEEAWSGINVQLKKDTTLSPIWWRR